LKAAGVTQSVAVVKVKLADGLRERSTAIPVMTITAREKLLAAIPSNQACLA